MTDLKQLHEQGKQITQDLADLKRGIGIEAESDEPNIYGALGLLERLTDIVARMEARDRQLRGEE